MTRDIDPTYIYTAAGKRAMTQDDLNVRTQGSPIYFDVVIERVEAGSTYSTPHGMALAGALRHVARLRRLSCDPEWAPERRNGAVGNTIEDALYLITKMIESSTGRPALPGHITYPAVQR